MLHSPRAALPSRFGFRIHKQATGLVWIGFLRPASPLRDSAGVSPDFAGLSTAHHFTDALNITVAETDTGPHNSVWLVYAT
jgi:hypothetical protein